MSKKIFLKEDLLSLESFDIINKANDIDLSSATKPVLTHIVGKLFNDFDPVVILMLLKGTGANVFQIMEILVEINHGKSTVQKLLEESFGEVDPKCIRMMQEKFLKERQKQIEENKGFTLEDQSLPLKQFHDLEKEVEAFEQSMKFFNPSFRK